MHQRWQSPSALTKRGLHHSFSHILLLSCQLFWPALFVIPTLMDTFLLTQKTKTNKQTNRPRRLLCNEHKLAFWELLRENIFFPLKSHRNKISNFYFTIVKVFISPIMSQISLKNSFGKVAFQISLKLKWSGAKIGSLAAILKL